MRDQGANNCLGLVMLNERLVTGTSVRTQSAQICNGLDKVGFALTVRANQQVNARFERDVGCRVVPKMRKGEVFN